MKNLTLTLVTIALLCSGIVSPAFARGEGFPVGTVHVDLQGNTLPPPVKTPPPLPGAIPVVLPPSIDLFRTKVTPAKGTFIVCPGGAYHGLAVFSEGVPMAEFLNQLGYDVAILEYTHASVKARPDAVTRVDALHDALTAISLVQEKGTGLGLHTANLGIVGFSAGGHLTARAVHELGAKNPFAKVILIYPAYLNTPKLNNSTEPVGITDDVKPVPGSKSQVFVTIGDKDNPLWMASSQVYSQSATANGQVAEFHLLTGIKHGFGIKPGDETSTTEFQKQLTAFLNK